MARRAVVEAPPDPPSKAPSGRKAVVAKPPPKKPAKGQRRHEWVWGVLGVLLLAATFVVSAEFTKDPPPTPTFQVVFDAVEDEHPSQSAELAEGDTASFAFAFTAQNMTNVQFRIEFEDDVPPSNPDRFSFVLLDPEGNTVLEGTDLQNQPATADTSTTPTTYEPVPYSETFGFALAARPPTLVIETDEPGTTAGDVATQVAAEHSLGGAGTWTVEVTLEDAGGCATSTDDPERTLACEAAADDVGNMVFVSGLKFLYYEAAVTAL